MAFGSANVPGNGVREAKIAAQNALDKATEALENGGPSGCMIKITFDTGFKGQPYTITDGHGDTKTGVVPDNLVDSVSVENCNTTYTITASADGVEYSSTVTTGAYFGQYTATLTVFTATIKVTTGVSGAKVTATLGTLQYEATAASNGIATLTVKKSGTYSIAATYDGCTASSGSAAATTNGQTYNVTVNFISVTVTIDSGSSVSIKSGSTTKTGTSTGTVKFYLPSTGTWTITATKGDQTATGSISATAYQSYSVTLSYVKVFGVSWDKSNSSTALTRLTKAADPNGHVNVDITTNPAPAVGTGAGSSPFDNYAPWNGMEEYNIINNAVSYKKGQTGFSRTNNDTVVYIPEFYYKISLTNGKMCFYVADKAVTGFTKHPGSGKYVGRYQTGANYVSKSGLAPLVNITRPAARTGSKGKGSKWGQYDYASWCAVWLLYLVEFANWDSQSKIGRGYVDGNSAGLNSGSTDAMTYHTGRPAGTDGKTGVQYRWIENPWGSVFDWIDGINFNNRKAYICTNPANYADDTATNYTDTGVTLCSSGWIKDLTISSNFNWAFLPTTNGGSETTYIPDYVYSDTGWMVLYVGGYYSYASNAGLFCFNADNSSSYSNSLVGARLLYHP